MTRKEYFHLLSGQIHYKKVIPLVTNELAGHMDEQKQDFMAEGMTEQEAEDAAVLEMGDPVEAGAGLDRIHRPHTNWRLAAGIGLISLTLFAVQYYLNFHIGKRNAIYLYDEFNPSAYVLYMAAGFLIMLGICYIDYTWLARKAGKLAVAVCGILLFLLLGVEEVGNDIFWEGGVITAMQLIPFLFVPLYGAVLTHFSGEGYKGLVKSLVWQLPIFAALFFTDRTELFIFIPVMAFVLSAAVYKGYFHVPVRKTLLIIWAAAVLFAAGAIKVSFASAVQYGGEAFWVMKGADKYSTSEYEAFAVSSLQNVRSVVRNSHMLGEGSLPEQLAECAPMENGYILTYIAAYFGVLAAALVIISVCYLFFRMLRAVIRQKNRLAVLMGSGCLAVFFVHMLWYVLINMGLVFSDSLYCPFMGSMGRNMIVTYVLLGIILSIYRYQDVWGFYDFPRGIRE